MRYVPVLAWVLLLAGCVGPVGRVPLIARDTDLVGTKLLRPGATARSCRATVLGIPLGADAGTIDQALARALALDAEGDLLTDVVVHEEHLVTGIYNRRCVVLRGELARSIRTIILPAPAGHHGH